MVTLCHEFQSDLYPFTSHYLDINGFKMHYIDEGSGPPFLMLHGNPTWSFFYRNIIKEISSTHRCIAPDHLGCGLSDKPQNYQYNLQNHLDNIIYLIEQLNITKFNLIVHDWGGTIGMGLAGLYPDKINKIIVLNSTAFVDPDIPKRINILRLPLLGEIAIRKFNVFARYATFMATEKGLSETVLRGFLFPYDNYHNRIAIHRFVKDIPMTKRDSSFSLLQEIERRLSLLKDKQMLILWGAKDFCFNVHFYNRWKAFFPDAKYYLFENGGHYLLEDEMDKIMPLIKAHIGLDS